MEHNAVLDQDLFNDGANAKQGIKWLRVARIRLGSSAGVRRSPDRLYPNSTGRRRSHMDKVQSDYLRTFTEALFMENGVVPPRIRSPDLYVGSVKLTMNLPFIEILVLVSRPVISRPLKPVGFKNGVSNIKS